MERLCPRKEFSGEKGLSVWLQISLSAYRNPTSKLSIDINPFTAIKIISISKFFLEHIKFPGEYFRKEKKTTMKVFYGLRNLTNLKSAVYCFTNIYGITNVSECVLLSHMPKVINGPVAGY